MLLAESLEIEQRLRREEKLEKINVYEGWNLVDQKGGYIYNFYNSTAIKIWNNFSSY